MNRRVPASKKTYDTLSDQAAERRPQAYADGRQASLVSRPTSARRILTYLALVILCLPVQLILRRITRRATWIKFCQWHHRRTLACFDIKLIETGSPNTDGPTLFVANHNSYLDIAALGACAPASFVAMEQVGLWPLFGLLSKLQDTVFIDRQVKSIVEQQRQLTSRLDQRQNLFIFPEGSSYTGTHILPFRSSLLAVAKHQVDGKPILIQPVSVTFAKLNGLPIPRGLRAFYGWYGNPDLLSHMVKAAGLGRLTLQVDWHPPKTLADFDGNRKTLTAYCEQQVRRSMAKARTA